MSTVAEPVKKRKFSKASLEASDRLLKTVKDKMLKEQGRLDEDALRQRGYSETTIARLLVL